LFEKFKNAPVSFAVLSIIEVQNQTSNFSVRNHNAAKVQIESVVLTQLSVSESLCHQFALSSKPIVSL